MTEFTRPLHYWNLQEKVSVPHLLYRNYFSTCQETEYNWLAVAYLAAQYPAIIPNKLEQLFVGTGSEKHQNTVDPQEVLVLNKKPEKLPRAFKQLPSLSSFLMKVKVSFGITDTKLILTGPLAGGVCALLPNYGESGYVCGRPLIGDVETMQESLSTVQLQKKRLLKDPLILLNFQMRAALQAETRILNTLSLELSKNPSYFALLSRYLTKAGIPHDRKTMEANGQEYTEAYYEAT